MKSIVLLIIALTATANATTLWTWSGMINSYSIAGTVQFTEAANNNSSYDLEMDISNTASAMPLGTADILTGIFFDISANVAQSALAMKSASATLGLLDATHTTSPNSDTVGANICAAEGAQSANDPTCTSTITGGWQFAYKASGLGGVSNATQRYGVGTAGLGIFNGNSVGNANYGVAPSAGANPNTDGLGNMEPYSYRSIVILLTGITTANFTISNVSAVYGTLPDATPGALDSTSSATPEPGTWTMLLGGFVLVLLSRLRRAPRVD